MPDVCLTFSTLLAFVLPGAVRRSDLPALAMPDQSGVARRAAENLEAEFPSLTVSIL